MKSLSQVTNKHIIQEVLDSLHFIHNLIYGRVVLTVAPNDEIIDIRFHFGALSRTLPQETIPMGNEPCVY